MLPQFSFCISGNDFSKPSQKTARIVSLKLPQRETMWPKTL